MSQKRILSLQDCFPILQFLDEQDIPLYCQGSYLLQQSIPIFNSLSPNDIDIFGEHPNLEQLELNLLSFLTIQTKRTTYYLQFTIKDCDITIYRDLSSLGIGMSNYDAIAPLIFTEHGVQLGLLQNKAVPQYVDYTHGPHYTIYPYKDTLNIKGLFHYFFIGIQLPVDKPFPSLSKIPKSYQLDQSKVQLYASLIATNYPLSLHFQMMYAMRLSINLLIKLSQSQL